MYYLAIRSLIPSSIQVLYPIHLLQYPVLVDWNQFPEIINQLANQVYLLC